MLAGAEARARSAADLADCQRLLRDGSRSFFVASRLLPRQVRDPATVLYAFCRDADDAVDIDGGQASALASLRARLDAIYAGWPGNTAIDRAMTTVVADFALPRVLPDALLEGLAWDADGRRYECLSDVRAYGARVAGSVGAMMALIMGVRSPLVLAQACELGVAMQLTNIARDVGEDARAGRLYLPRDWLREAGIDADRWLAEPVFNPAIAAVVERLLAAAAIHYARAERGIAALPAGCRPGIRAARRVYAQIGREIAHNGYDSVSQRAVVSMPRKLALLAGIASGCSEDMACAGAPAIAETRFMLDAIAARRAIRSAHSARLRWWQMRARLIRILELFRLLHERDRLDKRRAQASNDYSR